MNRYKNLSRRSNILAYEIQPYSIWIMLKDGSNYLYTYKSTGEIKVKMMHFLAASGIGLSSFIKQFAANSYAVRSE